MPADAAQQMPEDNMRIAQISPLVESVPPRLYGGTERVVAYLTEELVAQGHDVTLFASGDFITNANLIPCYRGRAPARQQTHDPVPHLMMMLDKVLRKASEFDILHFHIDHLHFPLIRQLRDADGHHTAWAAGPSRHCAVLCLFPRHTPHFDFRLAARSHRRGELRRNRAPWTAARSASCKLSR